MSDRAFILSEAERSTLTDQIYARCLMPCQDTPASKFTFSASVTSAHRIVMSASPVLDVPSSGPLPHASDTLYLFRQVRILRCVDINSQTVPITTSIFAIAGGPFQYRQLASEPVPIGIWATVRALPRRTSQLMLARCPSQSSERVRSSDLEVGAYSPGCFSAQRGSD